MDFPGEKLVTRLWETLADKGIGSLLRPWQIRREGRARADVRKEEMLLLAQAEQDIDDIKAGRVRLLSDGRLQTCTSTPISDSTERLPSARLTYPALVQQATDTVVADTVRKEINIAKALLHAESDLENDAQQPPESAVDNDWLFRWRDSAGTVSNEELQHLWGRVLSGEVKSPGTFSLRALEFLRNISQSEAKDIERLAPFVVEGFVHRDNKSLDAVGISFKFLLNLQDTGILSGVEAVGLELTLSTVLPESFKRFLLARNRLLLITHPDPKKTVKLQVYQVTSIGAQVLKLGNYETNVDYLKQIGKKICADGFDVTLASFRWVDESRFEYSDELRLCAPITAATTLGLAAE
jgi:hypothetical protein